MTTIDQPIDLTTYFERIGFTGSPEPTLDCLSTLVRMHAATIPFEGIDVILGRGVNLAPQTVDDKMLNDHRGGYCFEHTSLMRRALDAIGFDTEQHLARVWVRGDPQTSPAPQATHTSLKVTVDGKPWLVDVGFGGFMPNEPLAWHVDNPQKTDFGTYRLKETRSGHMLESTHENQWSPLYEILDFNWQPADFKVANHYTATHPDSHFRTDLMVALTRPGERITLAGNRLRHAKTDGSHREQILDASTLIEALESEFGLPVQKDWIPLLNRAAGI